ncbi:MAG: hypothetical protein K0R47_2396 [Brevibacillus sp.]|jgi:hypothetical protein|nr:hypothetical protein [Brevibacillus sp.]
MWLIVKEKELKAYFEGLRRLVWGNERPNPPQETACPKEPEIRQVLLRYVNQSIEIGTEAGNVAGVLQAVGEDYAQVAEAGGTIVLIPFRQINFVHVV